MFIFYFGTGHSFLFLIVLRGTKALKGVCVCVCLWLKESVSRIWRQARRWAVFGGSSNQWEAYVSLSNTADRWVRGEQPKRSHLLLCRSSDRQLVAEVWSTLGSRPETGEEAHQESSTALQPLRCTITPPCLALSPQVSFFHIIFDIFTPFHCSIHTEEVSGFALTCPVTAG